MVKTIITNIYIGIVLGGAVLVAAGILSNEFFYAGFGALFIAAGFFCLHNNGA